MGVWLCHLSNKLWLLTCAFLFVSNRTSVRTSSSHLSCPAHGSGRNRAFASRPCTCQPLLTCIPTSCSVSGKAWRVVHPGWASRCLRQWRRHAVWHWQPRDAGLCSQGFVACSVPRYFLERLLLRGRGGQVIEGVELVAITVVALSLGLRQLLWSWVT
jgi:hypothetical protein